MQRVLIIFKSFYTDNVSIASFFASSVQIHSCPVCLPGGPDPLNGQERGKEIRCHQTKHGDKFILSTAHHKVSK